MCSFVLCIIYYVHCMCTLCMCRGEAKGRTKVREGEGAGTSSGALDSEQDPSPLSDHRAVPLITRFEIRASFS